MDTDRVSTLETRMYMLAQDNARLSQSVDNLATSVRDLSVVVQQFRDTFNQGKGAVWLFGLAATALGGLVSWVMTRLFQA